MFSKTGHLQQGYVITVMIISISITIVILYYYHNHYYQGKRHGNEP